MGKNLCSLPTLVEGEAGAESLHLLLGQEASLLPPLHPWLHSMENYSCAWMWSLLTICNAANNFSITLFKVCVCVVGGGGGLN